MILLLAVAAGLAAGGLRAWWRKQALAVPDIHLVWLVFLAYLPQYLVFLHPYIRERAPDDGIKAALVGSQAILLVFVWYNRKHPGFWLMGLGLLANLVVISANGGFMPISPETASKLAPELPAETWVTGDRLGRGKDLILARDDTNLWWLSDLIVWPFRFPYKAAFSLGDVFIAAGVIWFLWQAGGTHPT